MQCRVNFCFLLDKMQSTLPTKADSRWHHHVTCEFFAFTSNRCSLVSFLSPWAHKRLFWLLAGGFKWKFFHPWRRLVSARRPAATTLFHGQERDLAIEPSLWPVQLYGTVYQQQFAKLTACIHLSTSSKCLMTDYLLYILQTFIMHSRSGAEYDEGHNTPPLTTTTTSTTTYCVSSVCPSVHPSSVSGQFLSVITHCRYAVCVLR